MSTLRERIARQIAENTPYQDHETGCPAGFSRVASLLSKHKHCNCRILQIAIDLTPSEFQVVHASRTISELVDNGPSNGIVIATDVTRDGAMVLAEVAASEHADGIDVEYAECGNPRDGHTGYTFRTNNGSYVWYTVREA